MIMLCELEIMEGEGAIMTYFNVKLRHLPGNIEEIKGNITNISWCPD
jgi:hypothetical protein